MSITIFSDKKCEGANQTVTSDLRDLIEGWAPRPCFGKTLVKAATATIAGVGTVLTNEFLAITSCTN